MGSVKGATGGRYWWNAGRDAPEVIAMCLNCDAPRCRSGDCARAKAARKAVRGKLGVRRLEFGVK